MDIEPLVRGRETSRFLWTFAIVDKDFPGASGSGLAILRSGGRGAFEEAIGEPTCASAWEDVDIVENGKVTVDAGYSNADCYKSYVIDVWNLTVGYPNFPGAGVRFDWSNETATSEAECEQQLLAVDAWDTTNACGAVSSSASGGFSPFNCLSSTGSGAPGNPVPIKAYGQWDGGSCHAPTISLGVNHGVALHGSYTFAVTARVGSATHAFEFSTQDGVPPQCVPHKCPTGEVWDPDACACQDTM
jgi:hypothetical protein